MASDDLTIAQTTANKDIIFTVNDGGVTTTLMTLDGDTGRLELPSVGDLRVKGNLTVDGDSVTNNVTTLTIEDNIIELNRNISSASGMPNYSGIKVNRGETSTATEQDLFWVWDETFADDGTTIHGNAGGAWTAFKSGGGDDELSAATLVDIRANVVHATATSAQYADLAERFEADQPYGPGTVVALGGAKEITQAQEDLAEDVFGVISKHPGHLMNALAGTDETHPPVAMSGRTPVKVIGPVDKGDRLVAAGNGLARKAQADEVNNFNVIGRSLETKYSDEEGTVEAIVAIVN